MNERQFVLQGPEQAEILVRCQTTALGIQSQEVEAQTLVRHGSKRVELRQALKEVTLECFSAWESCGRLDREAFIRETLTIKETSAATGEELVFLVLNNPLQPQAVARAMLLGHNFLRTLDICLEALLRYPSQKSLTRKPLRTQVVIDWAIGGIQEWVCNYPYSFELGPDGKPAGPRLAHVTRHYEIDRGARSQISHKQIANIFLLRDSTVADLERRGVAQLRAELKPGV